MLYIALSYLIIVTIYGLMFGTKKGEDMIVEKLEKEKSEIFTVFSARQVYRMFIVPIILLSPFIVLYSIVSILITEIFGAFVHDTRNSE